MKLLHTLILIFLHLNLLGQASASFKASVTIINPENYTPPEAVKISRINSTNFLAFPDDKGKSGLKYKEISRENIALIELASFQLDSETSGNFRMNFRNGEHLLTNGNAQIKVIDFSSNQGSIAKLSENLNILEIAGSILVQQDQEPGVYSSLDQLEIIVDYD